MVEKEEIRKELERARANGVKVQALANKFNAGKSTVYELLDDLREDEAAYNQDGLWFSSQSRARAHALEAPRPSPPVVSVNTTLKEIELIKEEYVNRQIDKAYRRTLVLSRADNSLPKAWIVEMKDTFARLVEEEAAIRADTFERINPARQQRILQYEGAIVSAALKHWLSDKRTR